MVDSGQRDLRREEIARGCAEGWVTPVAAPAVYSVVLTGTADDDSLAVDAEATARLREKPRREGADSQ